MKPTRTWIFLADSGSARIVENCGPGKGLFQIFETKFETDNESKFSDRQGRSFDSASTGRHKLEPNRNGDADLAENIKSVLKVLKRSHDNSEFDQLIVCAAPHTLGAIREQMPNSLKKPTIAELSKDLVRVSTADLPKHFESVLAV